MDFLEEELEEILNIFREESEEQIEKLNQGLLKLEKNSQDKDVISELFREAHSIKGAARMIGLNDIQSVAHKIEDIIGLAKDNRLKITPSIVDVLCRAVDCINSIIEESLKTLGQSHSPHVDTILQELSAIEESIFDNSVAENCIADVKEEKQAIDEAKYKEFFCKIVPDIPEILVNIDKIKENSTNTFAIENLHRLISEINSLAELIGHNDLNNCILNIKNKLDSVKKGSGILLPVEVNEINTDFESFLKLLRQLNSQLGLEFYCSEQPIVEKENNFQEEISVDPPLNDNQSAFKPEKADNDLASKVLFVNENIPRIVESTPEVHRISENILNCINFIVNKSANEASSRIYKKIAEIISSISEARNKPDREIAEVIRQSSEIAGGFIAQSKEVEDEDPELIIQRLSILQQMLELSEEAYNNKEQINQNVQNQEQPENNDFQVEKVDYSPVVQNNTEIVSEKVSNAISGDLFKVAESSAIKTLRVDTKKLDKLVNQVGELIIAKIKANEHLAEIEKINRFIEDWYREWNKSKQYIKNLDRRGYKTLESSSIAHQNKNIYALFEENASRVSSLMQRMNLLYRTVQEDDARLSLVVNEIEQMVKSIRVLPLATIFHMFPRMVRDISRSKGKRVELVVSGSETSADKKIIEEIKSPLTHIIRNSIDHGIETPEERIKNGKNPVGKIFLSATHLENSILIEIVDDGRGIDLEKIKEKVLQKGLLTPAELEAMNDNQIMNIVFWPGFSTGDMVTDISGRGIGLDVVHTKISQLNGKVNINSRFGEGCRVTIQLPVTMATIKSFLVSVNNQVFAIPTSVIRTVSWIKPEDIFYKEGKETIIVDNKTVPIFKLSRVLELPDNDDCRKQDRFIVAVIQQEGVQVGFIIDKLVGEQEILHKNLQPPLIRVRNIAGVTTLGSGELCLILNVSDLIKSAMVSTEIRQKPVLALPSKTSTEKKVSILVVDDSMTTRILERNILRAAGFNVTVANNGLDALTKITSEKFDLIVSDVEMPEINGFELTRRLRDDDYYKDVPIILVTSLASEEDRKMGFSVGANAYITKGSFNQNELINTVKKLLNI